MIAKGELKIDHSYQRPFNLARAKKMAAAWDWDLYAPLTVCLRESGDYYIVDGQHRHGAAMLIDEITHLDCAVHLYETIDKEARIFKRANTEGVKPTPLEITQAGAVAGDPACVAFFMLCDELKLKPNRGGDSPGTLRPIDWVVRNLRRDQPATETLLRIIAEIIHAERKPISSILPEGLMYIHEHANVNLNDPVLARCIRACGALTLEQAATNAVSVNGGGGSVKGGARVWAVGMIVALNRQRAQLPRNETRKTPKFALKD